MDDGRTLGRVCKRCHALHPLTAFEGPLRTCAASLAIHNQRRCVARAHRAFAPFARRAFCASRLLPDCLAHLRCRRARKAQAQAATVVNALEAVASGDAVEAVVASAPVSSPGSPETQPPPTAASPSLPTLVLRQRDAGSAADLGRDVLAVLALKRFTVEVKLPHCATPASLPAGDVLADALFAWLGSSSSGSSVLLDTATVSIAPGCVRLVVDAFLDDVATGGGAATAQHLAAVLRRTCGAAARGAHAAGLCCDAAQAALFPLAAVLLPPNDVALPVPALCALPPSPARLAVRCGGRNVRCVASPGEGSLSLQLGSVPGPGGCLLVEARGSDGERLHRPRAVVASRDPALVAELNAAAARGELPDDVMQAVLHVLGDALSPRSTLAVRCAAARAASLAGWGATLAELCAAADSARPGGGAVVAVAASAYATSAPAIAALHAVAPPAAWAEAAARLRAALGADSSEMPHCAAFVAFTSAQADPTASAASLRLLAAVHACLLHTAEDDVDVALDAADIAAETAAFHAFRARTSAQAFFVSHALGLLAAFMRLHKTASLLGRTTWPTDAELGPSGADLVLGFRLHPVQAGAPLLTPRDVPWADVLPSLRLYVAFTVAVALPFQLVAFILSYRLMNGHVPSPRWYYGVFAYWFMAAYIGGHAVCDLCILRAAGAAPEWPAGIPTLMHSVFILLVWRKALFKPPLVHVTMAWCAACYFATLLAVAGPTVVFVSNPTNAILAAVIAFCFARAGPRERALRAAYAVSLKLKQS